MIKATNLSLSIDGKDILSATNLQFKPSEIVGLIGKSGAGKTSLLRIISGYVNPTEGEVIVNGIRKRRPYELLQLGYKEISMVGQEFEFDIYRTCSECLRLAMTDLNEATKLKFIEELLDLVDLNNQRDQQIRTLSGGEKQRLALVYAFAEERDYIFLDEPFVHMDNAMRTNVIQYLQLLKEKRGIGIVIVSHQAEEILGCCDRVVYMKAGKVRRKADTQTAYYFPKTIEEAELLGVVNSVSLDCERLLFRPNQYKLSGNGRQIKVNYQRSEFHGAFWFNYFSVENHKKSIVLFSLNPLSEKVKSIEITV